MLCNHVKHIFSGGNEYGQCGEEPERKDDTGRPLRRDIVIPQRCAPKLVVRQVVYLNSYLFFWLKLNQIAGIFLLCFSIACLNIVKACF